MSLKTINLQTDGANKKATEVINYIVDHQIGEILKMLKIYYV